MNIFALSFNQIECAQKYCDIHVRKMLVETAQILSTAVRVSAGVETIIPNPAGRDRKVFLLSDETYYYEDDKLITSTGLYVQTHINHPCCVWARHSMPNFYWLWGLGMALDAEYTKRSGKKHKSRGVIQWIGNTEFPIHKYITSEHLDTPYKITPWPLCVDDDIRQNVNPDNIGKVIAAYNIYYERKLVDFKNRGLL